jgi:predicted secreted protein
MEYIICFKTKDLDQFNDIKNARYISFELTKEVKERLNKNPEDYQIIFKEIINNNMDRLNLLSQDKATLEQLREFFKGVLHDEIIKKTLSKQDTTGYAEASEIIKKSLDKIDGLFKEEKKNKVNNFE